MIFILFNHLSVLWFFFCLDQLLFLRTRCFVISSFNLEKLLCLAVFTLHKTKPSQYLLNNVLQKQFDTCTRTILTGRERLAGSIPLATCLFVELISV